MLCNLVRAVMVFLFYPKVKPHFMLKLMAPKQRFVGMGSTVYIMWQFGQQV